ncbi:MAG TPA: PAS domain S-box protein [Labilithrix sp.]|nr:PAS domain S-box protein [Labilithrix sp.]
MSDEGDDNRALVSVVADTVPGMLAYWDAEQRCRYANAAYESWFGVKPADLIGKTLKELLGPIYERNLPYIEGALRGEAQTFEREIPDPHGGPPRFSLAQYVPDIADGRVRGFVVMVSDITERRQLEVRLRKATDGFEALFRLSPLGIVISAPTEGTIIDANEVALRLLGFTRDELVGRRGVDLGIIPADERERLFELVRAQGAVHDLETVFTAKSGEPHAIILSLQRIDMGEPRLITSFLDITERKRIEEEKRRALARFSGFVEAAPDAVVIADRDGIVVLVNAGAERLFGYARDELVGQPIEVLLPPRMRARHPAHRAAYMEDPKARPMGADLDLYGLRRDGTEVLVEISLSVLESDGGTLFCSVIRDVTARRRAQAALRDSLKEKDVLLHEVQHRVKNNLQVISSLMNMQLRKVDDAAARDALEECRTRVLAIALIHEKLYQSKDSGQVPFSDYIRSLASQVFHAGGASHDRIALELEIEEVVLPVHRAIPCGLIVNELITNALKHAFPANRAGTVRVELAARHGRLLVGVKDDGVGLPAGFDLRASKTLGLQLVTTLAEQLHATVEIGGGPRGAAFRVTLPLDG